LGFAVVFNVGNEFYASDLPGEPSLGTKFRSWYGQGVIEPKVFFCLFANKPSDFFSGRSERFLGVFSCKNEFYGPDLPIDGSERQKDGKKWKIVTFYSQNMPKTAKTRKIEFYQNFRIAMKS